MKKLFLLILFSNVTISELILEITQGTDDPYRVAIVEFSGDKDIANNVVQILKNNLRRTGEFVIFSNEDLISTPKDEDEIIFNDFKILNIDYLIVGNILNDRSNITNYKII